MKKLSIVLAGSMFMSLLGLEARADIATLYPTQDAEIMTSAGSSTTVANTNYGASPYLTLTAGTPYGPAFSASTAGLFPRTANSYGLVQFDLSSIPAGSTIDNAVLTLYSAGYNGDSASWPNALYPLTSSWSELGVTYNTRPTQGAVGIALSSSGSYGPFVYNVTGLAQGWFNGTVANYGLITSDVHRGVSSGRYFTRLYSRETVGTTGTDLDPRLDVTYTAPVVPEPSSMVLLTLGFVTAAGKLRKDIRGKKEVAS